MARRTKKIRTFDPLDPVYGYQWINLLRGKIRHGLAKQGWDSLHLEGFLRACYVFSLWDSWLARARVGGLYSNENERIERAGVDPRQLAQIAQQHRRVQQWREDQLHLLFPCGTPDWMVLLLDWPAQWLITDGH